MNDDGAIAPPIAFSEIHVLVVDSERLSRLVVGNVFRRSGYKGP